MRKKKQILTPEQKAQKKITQAKWYLENKEERKRYSQKWKKENPDKVKARSVEFYKKNPNYNKEWHKKNPDYIPPSIIADPNYSKEQSKRFHKANPGYSKEHNHKHDLGFWIVYIITNYNGLGDDYCGQTQNIYKRMVGHKCIGRLNTDTYTIVKKCDTLEDALELESAVHNFGYHGDCRTESGK